MIKLETDIKFNNNLLDLENNFLSEVSNEILEEVDEVIVEDVLDIDINLDVDIENIESDLLDDDLIELGVEGEDLIELEAEDDSDLYLTSEEKNILAEKDEKLVQYMAKRFSNTGIAEDELVGIAYEGYVKALNMYKKNKKTKFSTYACKCMGNEILCFLRKEKKWTDNVTSMNAPIGVDKNGNTLDLEKILKEESSKGLDEMVISKDIDALVLESLSTLNDTEKLIIIYRFGLGGAKEKTQKTIAQELGISQAYVSKLEKDCLGKIKKYIQEEDLKNGVLGKNSYYNY